MSEADSIRDLINQGAKAKADTTPKPKPARRDTSEDYAHLGGGPSLDYMELAPATAVKYSIDQLREAAIMLRSTADLTLEQAGRLFGVHYLTILRFENGPGVPSRTLCLKYCNYCLDQKWPALADVFRFWTVQPRSRKRIKTKYPQGVTPFNRTKDPEGY